MGELIEFPSNGSRGGGYLAVPDGGGPGVVVIQEWWGLVDHIRDVCDRFASEGFTALAPDLYHGEATTEPDEAGKLMMALNADRAARDLTGAVDELVRREEATGDSVGVVGYCMGGGLALYLATLRPDEIAAVAPYYGVIPWETVQPDWSQLDATVQGHYADGDGMLPVEQVRQLERRLRETGNEVELLVYEDTGHGFFNDTRPDAHRPEAAARAWTRTLELFRRHLV